MVTALIGKWTLSESENFDEFLKALDIGMTWRKIASSSKPTVTISKEGEEWSLKTSTMLKSSEIKFKIGEEFTEHRIDGKDVKCKCQIDGDKLVQTQYDEKQCLITRWVENEMMITKCEINDITSTRKYKKN